MSSSTLDGLDIDGNTARAAPPRRGASSSTATASTVRTARAAPPCRGGRRGASSSTATASTATPRSQRRHVAAGVQLDGHATNGAHGEGSATASRRASSSATASTASTGGNASASRRGQLDGRPARRPQRRGQRRRVVDEHGEECRRLGRRDPGDVFDAGDVPQLVHRPQGDAKPVTSRRSRLRVRRWRRAAALPP